MISMILYKEQKLVKTSLDNKCNSNYKLKSKFIICINFFNTALYLCQTIPRKCSLNL